MLEAAPTPDTVYISSLTKADLHTSAISCKRDTNAAEVEDLLRHSLSANTLKAHKSDLKHYAIWGGTIPATPATVAAYVAAFAGCLTVSTIERRIATLSKAHDIVEADNPCRSALVKATLQGLKRKHGIAPKQAKALMRDDLFAALDAMGGGVKDARDRALLLLGFAGGFRRSELVGLDVSDIELVRQGLVVTLRRSKTDQEGAGRRIGIPVGRTQYCPVAAVTEWFSCSTITDGPVLRPINRHGHLQDIRLSGDAVSEIVRERVAAIGIDPIGYSGHSLRSGFATSAAQAGVPSLKIRQQTGHASDAMLARYVHEGELFTGNAAGVLL